MKNVMSKQVTSFKFDFWFQITAAVGSGTVAILLTHGSHPQINMVILMGILAVGNFGHAYRTHKKIRKSEQIK